MLMLESLGARYCQCLKVQEFESLIVFMYPRIKETSINSMDVYLLCSGSERLVFLQFW